MGSDWTDRARAKVSEWQERAYGGLAEDLGWGWDPQRACDHFKSEQVAEDDYRISVDRLKKNLGYDHASATRWQEIEQAWDEYKKHYYYIEPPTKYEDPNIYSNAFANLTAITLLIEQVMPGQLTSTPRVATLPTGELNAKIRSIRGTNEVAILLQQGLTGFVYHFSSIVACAVPTDLVNSTRPVPSRGRWGDPGDRKHLAFAGRYFADLIDAYVVRGDPYLLPDPDLRGRASYNQVVIGSGMRQFPLCHELAHLAYKHLDGEKSLSREECWNREFLADEIGSSLVAGIYRDYDGPPSVNTAIWACNVVLAGFSILEECVAFLSTGSRNVPESDTHPPLGLRRENMLQFQARTLMRAAGESDARSLENVFNDGEQVLRRLAGLLRPHLEELHASGVKPSPIWRARQVPDL